MKVKHWYIPVGNAQSEHQPNLKIHCRHHRILPKAVQRVSGPIPLHLSMLNIIKPSVHDPRLVCIQESVFTQSHGLLGGWKGWKEWLYVTGWKMDAGIQEKAFMVSILDSDVSIWPHSVRRWWERYKEAVERIGGC
jgi:hypothetical protein